MDLKKRFQEIAQFLKPYQRIWENEIMLQYPDPVKDYPAEWVEELASFRDRDVVIGLEKKELPELKSASLKAFYQRIDELCQLESIPALPAFPERRFSFLYMIPKKEYEIKKLAPFVNALYQSKGLKKIVDIGGGQGHLAVSLTNHYNLKTVSVDMDPALQKTGIERHEKNFRFADNKVEFVNVKVSGNEEKFQNLLSPESMTLGLHTCGPLANYQIKASAEKKIKGIISLGCCFDKLVRDENTQNISDFAQKSAYSLNFNQYALTLATRAHRKMDEKDYEFKLKVKFFRYAIHFLLHDHYGLKDIVPLGNTHHKIYEGPFADYVFEQMKRISLEPRHTKDELNEYFARADIQELIWKMLAAGLIRNALGRPMELYILLDRAIYLMEQGYEVSLLEFFEEPISPRNIGIVATLS